MPAGHWADDSHSCAAARHWWSVHFWPGPQLVSLSQPTWHLPSLQVLPVPQLFSTGVHSGLGAQWLFLHWKPALQSVSPPHSTQCFSMHDVVSKPCWPWQSVVFSHSPLVNLCGQPVSESNATTRPMTGRSRRDMRRGSEAVERPGEHAYTAPIPGLSKQNSRHLSFEFKRLQEGSQCPPRS